MPHAFDLSGLRHLIDGLARLAESAREHEHRLRALASSTESATQIPVPSSPHDVAMTVAGVDLLPAAIGFPNSAALTSIHDLCVAARDQRLLAEQLMTSIGGAIDGQTTSRFAHTVLVVDDSDDNRDLAATILDGYGFHVATAKNGLEAIIAAHCTVPSAILMDITMPVLNGIEAARLLKASPVTRDIQVLAYTANPGFYDGPLRQLFTQVLSKPAHPDAIAQLVLQTIHGSNGGRA
jgi:CheY-like chemotaxis protein